MAGGSIAPAAMRLHLTVSLFTGGCVGRRGGGTVTAVAGMSVVTVVSSAQVRAASAWAHSHVEFVLVQAAVRESGLERIDHVLAVGVRCPQAAAACRRSLFRSRDHRYLPGSRCLQSVARLLRDGQPRSRTLPCCQSRRSRIVASMVRRRGSDLFTVGMWYWETRIPRGTGSPARGARTGDRGTNSPSRRGSAHGLRVTSGVGAR
jgi:hypothetical protein